MDEQIYNNLKLGLVLSKLNLAMSVAEATESCEIYFKITSSEIIDNILILSIEPKHETNTNQTEKTHPKQITHKIEKWLRRLALAKDAYLLIGEVQNFEILLTQDINPQNSILMEISKNKGKAATFKISKRKIGKSLGKEKAEEITPEKKEQEQNINERNKAQLAKTITTQGFHKVNLTNPDLEFTILDATKTLLGIKLWENTDLFEERKAHLRPVLHPTATDPRLARAMINLASANKEVLDPFCGAGGTLLEATTIGIKSIGTDIDPLMIKRAMLNLIEEPNVELLELDALTWQTPVECVVTDLPYGKSSKLDGSIENLLTKFLNHYINITNRIVVCFPENTQINIPKEWKVKYDFNIYIHKSLTRKILVLVKS